MKIEKTMNLAELAERMGPDATEADAAAMRQVLLGHGYEGCYTEDIEDWHWAELIEDSQDSEEWERDGWPCPCAPCGCSNPYCGEQATVMIDRVEPR